MLPERDRKRGDAAGHRRGHRQQAGQCLGWFQRDAEHFQARLRAGVLGRGLGVVASGLIQVPIRGDTELVLRLLALQVLLGQFERIGGFLVVLVGLPEIRRIDHRQHLTPRYAIAECDLERNQPAAQRRKYRGGARRIGFDDGGQHQLAADRPQRRRHPRSAGCAAPSPRERGSYPPGGPSLPAPASLCRNRSSKPNPRVKRTARNSTPRPKPPHKKARPRNDGS